MLQFFGRGAAFCDTHNGACFTTGDTMVLLDCPMVTFTTLKQMASESLTASFPYKEIVVLVTHTHSDHIGGLPLLCHYADIVLHVPVTVIAPSAAVRRDINYLLHDLDGCRPYGLTYHEDGLLPAPDREGGYRTDEAGYVNLTEKRYPWLVAAIPTKHAPALKDRCFGYALTINGRDVVYTGDTCTLEPYEKYLHKGAYLYTEIAAFDSPVHLYMGRALPALIEYARKGVKVYLMHLDDEEKIREAIKGTGLQIAPLLTD